MKRDRTDFIRSIYISPDFRSLVSVSSLYLDYGSELAYQSARMAWFLSLKIEASPHTTTSATSILTKPTLLTETKMHVEFNRTFVSDKMHSLAGRAASQGDSIP